MKLSKIQRKALAVLATDELYTPANDARLFSDIKSLIPSNPSRRKLARALYGLYDLKLVAIESVKLATPTVGVYDTWSITPAGMRVAFGVLG